VERFGGERFRFLCITDHEDLLKNHSEWAIPLKRPGVEGWWCLPEKFRITGPVMFTGIDTVICGDIAPFADAALACPEDALYMIHPFRIPNRFNRLYANGILLWNGDHSWFFRDYDYTMAKTQFPLEQDYTSAMFIKHNYDIRVVQKAVPGVYSWKVNLNKSVDRPPEDARVILFHGKQKPHLETKGWLGEHIERFNREHIYA